MTVKRQPDGKWSVDFYVDGRGSQRVRRCGFASKAHAQRFERDYVASPRLSVERLSDLFDLWYQIHGVTLKRGAARYATLQRVAERLGNPRSCDFTSASWSTYRINRLKVSAKSSSLVLVLVSVATVCHCLRSVIPVFLASAEGPI